MGFFAGLILMGIVRSDFRNDGLLGDWLLLALPAGLLTLLAWGWTRFALARTAKTVEQQMIPQPDRAPSSKEPVAVAEPLSPGL